MRTWFVTTVALAAVCVSMIFATATMAEYLRGGGGDSHLAAALYPPSCHWVWASRSP